MYESSASHGRLLIFSRKHDKPIVAQLILPFPFQFAETPLEPAQAPDHPGQNEDREQQHSSESDQTSQQLVGHEAGAVHLAGMAGKRWRGERSR